MSEGSFPNSAVERHQNGTSLDAPPGFRVIVTGYRSSLADALSFFPVNHSVGTHWEQILVEHLPICVVKYPASKRRLLGTTTYVFGEITFLCAFACLALPHERPSHFIIFQLILL